MNEPVIHVLPRGWTLDLESWFEPDPRDRLQAVGMGSATTRDADGRIVERRVTPTGVVLRWEYK